MPIPQVHPVHRFCEQQAVEGGSGKVANYLRSKYIYDLDVIKLFKIKRYVNDLDIIKLFKIKAYI